MPINSGNLTSCSSSLDGDHLPTSQGYGTSSLAKMKWILDFVMQHPAMRGEQRSPIARGLMLEPEGRCGKVKDGARLVKSKENKKTATPTGRKWNLESDRIEEEEGSEEERRKRGGLNKSGSELEVLARAAPK